MPSNKGRAPPARSAVGIAPPRTAAEIPAQRSIDAYVGARLKRLRELSGMELSEVSAEIGTPEDSIARYERGEERPPPTDFIALAKLFGVSLPELFPEDSGQITGRLH
jgi:ribosome-binding protein aMBF1 (putative translation factor)